jgi:hypothetical protein
MMEASSLTWLAADYQLPATYSCRVPMSSITSALALPAPGPATVRLALLRPFFSCILSEFRDASVAWHEVMPVVGTRVSNALRLDVCVWPLVEVSQHGSGKLLIRQAFTRPEDAEAWKATSQQ